MTNLSITRLGSGGVITNYHCVSRCGHCLYNCSPHRARDYLDKDTAEDIFRTIADLGCPSVHIGGGEPLLDPPKLKTVLEAAAGAGVGIDYVETNSAWFVEPAQAMTVIEDLQEAGVGTLLVSISPFHNAHIPFTRVRGVIDACRRTGMGIFPWSEDFVSDLNRLDPGRTHSLDAFAAAFGADYLRRIPDRYWIHLGGRALTTFREVHPLYPADRILKTTPGGCARALSDVSHFHIDLYGNYTPGLCAGLAISMDDLGRPQSAERYPLLNLLAAEGICGLYNLASQTWGYRPRHRGYLNHCDLCTDIRNYLLQQDRKKFPELAPAGFYAEIPSSMP